MSETLQVLDKYNSLYTTTMVFGGIIVALFGIFIPLMVMWYQNRKLNLEKENLKTILLKELSSEVDLYIKSQEQKFEEKLIIIEQKFEEKLRKIEVDFEKKSSVIDGSTFHIQGNFNLSQKDFAGFVKVELFFETEYVY